MLNNNVIKKCSTEKLSRKFKKLHQKMYKRMSENRFHKTVEDYGQIMEELFYRR